MNNPLVSVLLPVYNCEDYIARAIQSVLSQTYQNLELLILDDASTDKTPEIISTFRDSRIQVVKAPLNTQKIGIVNVGVQMSRGELIAFQDADDWSEPMRLEKQVQMMQDKPELVICFTGYDLGSVPDWNKKYRTSSQLLKQEFHQLGFLDPGYYFPTVCATMMIRASILNLEPGYHPFFKGRSGEDIHWVYRILKHGEGDTLPEELYHYNYNRPGSFTQRQEKGHEGRLLYSMKLVARIIEWDIVKKVDVLKSFDQISLLSFELEACKEALEDSSKALFKIKGLYEYSHSYRLGKLLLTPFSWLKKRGRP